jgi:hypothetical protein
LQKYGYDNKFMADVRPLFQLARQIAGKQPRTVVTDGAANSTKPTRKNTGHRN